METPPKALRAAFALLVLVTAIIWLANRRPAPVPASAPATAFSAWRAIEHVRAIAQRPHPSGSTEHVRVREYLLTTLRGFGLEPQIQDAIGIATHNSVAGHVLNVMARVPGRTATPAVLLVAHYDSVPASPGAGDDAAAVGVLLETLRALRSSPPVAHDVIALFTDGEESGLIGSAAFVRDHAWARDVGVVLNFEGRGTGGPSLMFETAVGNLDAVSVLRHVPYAMANSLSVTVYRYLPNDTDLSELTVLGQPALNFAFINGFARYHTAEDDMNHLDAGSVQHHGVQALALARAFSDGPLPRPRTGDAVFFTLPGVGLVLYPAGVALPLAILAAALALASCVLLRRREPRWVLNLALGIAGILVSVALGTAGAFGVSRVLERVVQPSVSEGSTVSLAFLGMAIALLALSFTGACWALVCRWASPVGAWMAALLVWSVAAVIVSAWLPTASFLVAWPLLACVVAALVELLSGDRRTATSAGWAATLLAAAVIAPLIFMTAVVAFGLALPGAMIIGFFVPFAAWLAAPRLEDLAAAGRWRMPVATFAAAVVLLAAGLLIFQRRSGHVDASLLAYALDAETQNAWLVTPAGFAHVGSWGAAALKSPARLTQSSSSSHAAPEWLSRVFSGEARVSVAEVRTFSVPGPDVAVAADELLSEGRKRLALRVVPASGTYSIRLRVIGTTVLSSALDDRPIDTSRYRSPSQQWTFGYVEPPDGGFELSLTVPAGKPIEIDVISRSLGLPTPVQAATAERPDGVVPINGGDQTVVHRRFQF